MAQQLKMEWVEFIAGHYNGVGKAISLTKSYVLSVMFMFSSNCVISTIYNYILHSHSAIYKILIAFQLDR